MAVRGTGRLVRTAIAFLVIEHLSESYEQQVKLLQAAREHLLNEEVSGARGA